MFKANGSTDQKTKMPVPMFLAGFFILMVLNSFHMLPQSVLNVLEYASKWCLIMAITAVGMKTSLKTLFSLGWRPFLLVFLNTLFITFLYFAVITTGII